MNRSSRDRSVWRTTTTRATGLKFQTESRMCVLLVDGDKTVCTKRRYIVWQYSRGTCRLLSSRDAFTIPRKAGQIMKYEIKCLAREVARRHRLRWCWWWCHLIAFSSFFYLPAWRLLIRGTVCRRNIKTADNNGNIHTRCICMLAYTTENSAHAKN